MVFYCLWTIHTIWNGLHFISLILIAWRDAGACQSPSRVISGCEEGEGKGVVSFYQDAKMRQASGYHVTGTGGALCRVSEPGGGLLITAQSNLNWVIHFYKRWFACYYKYFKQSWSLMTYLRTLLSSWSQREHVMTSQCWAQRSDHQVEDPMSWWGSAGSGKECWMLWNTLYRPAADLLSWRSRGTGRWRRPRWSCRSGSCPPLLDTQPPLHLKQGGQIKSCWDPRFLADIWCS